MFEAIWGERSVVAVAVVVVVVVVATLSAYPWFDMLCT